MRILLDNCVPKRFGKLLSPHEVFHASDLGWEQLQNGRLLTSAEQAGYQVLLTVDRQMRFQQNMRARQISLVTIVGRTVTLSYIAELAPQVLAAIECVEPGASIIVGSQRDESTS